MFESHPLGDQQHVGIERLAVFADTVRSTQEARICGIP